MPDIWTKHPEIVRDLLKEGGFKCGVEPRILKGRDPNWTCIVNGKKLGGDLYIHRVEEILKTPPAVEPSGWSAMLGGWEFVLWGILLAIIVVQTWAIRRLKARTAC